MSLLQNEDFLVYQLRTAYLQQVNDGVGERLININSAFLNDASFRAAGWTPNPRDLKRCYSPPIPTSGTSDYFKAPERSARLGEAFDEEDEEGGMVTGRPSNDTVAPTAVTRRRRRRDADEDDDSSDLSDESVEAAETQSSKLTSSVKFARMPQRARSDSSPVREPSPNEGPSLTITSPSKPPDGQALDKPSLGNLDSLQTRPRRDTTTSSEISSENDLDPSFFRRKPISSRAAAAPKRLLNDQIAEEDSEDCETGPKLSPADKTEDETESDDLASEFSEDLADDSFLADKRPNDQIGLSTIARAETSIENPLPKHSQPAPDVLKPLPPPRPISVLQPVSALSQAIKAKSKKASSPFEAFAQLSASADQSPLWIKMHLPFASDPDRPMELCVRRSTNDGSPTVVAEIIGLSLWKYTESKFEPTLSPSKRSVNAWVLRTVEFGEVDYDFPALSRVRPMTDFTPNNNRPPRLRARDKPWDEFALVEADGDQRAENERLTPQYTDELAVDDALETTLSEPLTEEPPSTNELRPVATAEGEERQLVSQIPMQNPITDPRHAFAPITFRKNSLAADVPSAPASHAVPRSGAKKMLNIRYFSTHLTPQVTQLEVTTDTYISEVFDEVCTRLALEKAQFVLKVTGTSTVAPTDRLVESLGPNRDSLDLVRRRFVGDGAWGISGSPGSTSPNAPLLVMDDGFIGTGKGRSKRGGGAGTHPLAQTATNPFVATPGIIGLGAGALGGYKRYNVIRRQPMSFTGSHARVLAIDGEYLHIMPPNETVGAFVGGSREKMFDVKAIKTTTVHFSNVVGCKVSRKHPKNFRFLVFRERETKRYDFEVRSESEALEIVDEMKMGMEPFRTVVR